MTNRPSWPWTRSRACRLVFETSGGRVTRFEHNFQRVCGVPEQSAVLLGLLMLRGPQTAGELRINTERWYRFADISSVEGFLEELQDRAEEKGGPLVVKLPRAPGAREQRWAHLVCGPVDLAAGRDAVRGPPARRGRHCRTCRPHATALEHEVAQLREHRRKACAPSWVCRRVDSPERTTVLKTRILWRHPMDLAFTPEEQQFREDIRAWVKDNLPKPTFRTRCTTPCA
jgi:uncharacterized protein YceH (UPF0502 family)